MPHQPSAYTGKDSGDFFRVLLQSAPLPMFAMIDGECVYGNERYAKLLHIEEIPCHGNEFANRLNELDKQIFEQTIAALKVGEVSRVSLTLNQLDDKLLAVDLVISGLSVDGKTLALAVINEKNEKERIRRLLDRLAFHDTLTELPNRVLLFDRINQSLSRFQRDGSEFLFAILDLDGFKKINDEYGHAAGDALLKQISNSLSNAVRNVDTVARLGGDEFALIFQDVKNEEEAKSVLNKILLEIAKPYEVDNKLLSVTASIGIAFCPQDGLSIQELMGRADYAMYQAKREGGARYCISSGQMASVVSRFEIEPLIDIIKLGFDIIDEQHEEIGACIKGILRALSSGEDNMRLRRRIEYLQALTEEHFSTEEDLMLRYATHGKDEHVSDHTHLLRQLPEFFPSGDEHGLTIMSHAFKDWLIPHIMTKDTALVDQLKAAGITSH